MTDCCCPPVTPHSSSAGAINFSTASMTPAAEKLRAMTCGVRTDDNLVSIMRREDSANTAHPRSGRCVTYKLLFRILELHYAAYKEHKVTDSSRSDLYLHLTRRSLLTLLVLILGLGTISVAMALQLAGSVSQMMQ